ncbi:glycosyltransferase [Flavobacterium sp. JAS]|uniref:glycosyltransferase family 2 protein n=1 Tax=Flavobacterium sp. JAS TaxID=2897329 RepID=UPI001E58061B|nr:glycosyltransferase [Flavobacterium sp. JAS]MCD0471082.1 glycosyltransferase [Flavobacterium sp. JAS]
MHSGNKSTPFVAIWMVTYNHEKFIEEAVESVMAQKTDFEYKLFIGEDCSIDNTRAICLKLKSKYQNKIELFLNKNNIGANLNAYNVFNSCFESEAKYIALLEADDYWTDPLKLQKQVDFLENNANYSICWTKYFVKQESQMLSSLERPEWADQVGVDGGFKIDLDTVFTPYCTYTLTTLFRKEALDLDLLKKLRYHKDNSLYTLCLSKGDGLLLDFYSGVYRLHDGGIYSSTSAFKQKHYSYLNLKEIVSEIPNCNNGNMRSVRDYLLKESIQLHPDRFSLSYLNLIKDGINFFGIRECSSLIFNNFKNEG